MSNIQLQNNLDVINLKYSQLDTSFNLLKVSQISNISNTSLSSSIPQLNITSLIVFLSCTVIAAGSGWFVGKFLYSSLLFKSTPVVFFQYFLLKVQFTELESTFPKYTMFSTIDFTNHLESLHAIKKINQSKSFLLEDFLSRIVVEADVPLDTATDIILPLVS